MMGDVAVVAVAPDDADRCCCWRCCKCCAASADAEACSEQQ